MANSGAKKLVKANRQRLMSLALAIGGVNLLFLLRCVLLRSTFTRFQGATWVLFGAFYSASYLFLYTSARPQYDGKTLVDGGHDISQAGLFEYAHDLIYITLVTHVLFLFSRYALLFFAAAVVYVLYVAAASTGLLSLLGGARGAQDDAQKQEGEDTSAMTRKDRRKAERQAKRQR